MFKQHAGIARRATTAFAAILLAMPTLAQEQEDVAREPASAAQAFLDEIVVTAEKRDVARSAQDAPIAVNVLSGDAIEALQLDSVIDIGNTQPNVRLQSVGTVPGVANFSIRGIGLNSSVPSDEPTVGVVVDGVPLAATYGAYLDTFDVESVEVLRGPQGTLFGRNATGGVINLRSRRPGDTFGLRGRVTIGSQDRVSLAGSVEGPLAADTLFGKVAVMVEDRDGFFENGAIEGDEIGERSSVFVRPTLLWEPSDDFNLTLIAEYADIDGDGSIVQLTDRVGDLPNVFGFDPGADDVLFSDPEGDNNTNWLQLTSEINVKLGLGTLTSITGYRDSELSIGEPSINGPIASDNDGTTLNLFNLQNKIEQSQFSQEIRYAASALDDRLNFVVGGFYLGQDLDFQESRLVLGALGASPIATSSVLDQDSFGLFGQLEYELFPDLFLLAGGRYSSDEKRVVIASFGECSAVFDCAIGFQDDETFEDFSPKLGLRWEATEDVTAYLSYTRGFRSGGFNFRNTVPATPGPYDDESVSAYEFGLKTEFADGRVRANLAVFSNEYEDIQRTVLVSGTEQNVTNAASATIQGLELDLTLNPFDNLVLTGAIGVLDGEFDEFNGLDVTGDGIPDPDLALGLQLERAPELTYTIGALYDIPMSYGGLFTLRTSYSYTDETPINTVNTSFLPDFGLLNASVSYAFANDRTTLTLFGKNLTDEIYGVTGADIPGFVFFTYLEPSRTWGLELKYEY
ncbi:MAG: TonB-dependent receptor [Pseudomonadota bacterium]